MRRDWPWLLLPCLVAIAAVLPPYVSLPSVPPGGYGSPEWLTNPFGDDPPTHVVKDDGPILRLDPAGPWRLALRRGDVLSGFHVVEVGSDGRMAVHRVRYEKDYRRVLVPVYEAAEAQLPPGAVAAIAAAFAAEEVHELDRSYRDSHVVDGGRWDLVIRSGGRGRVVSCVNHFPAPIVRFVARLDAIIAESVGPTLVWSPIQFEEQWTRSRAVINNAYR